MAPKIIPDSHANRLSFFKNLKVQIAADAATLNITGSLLTSINAMLDRQIAAYQKLVDAESAVAVASADAVLAFDLDVDGLHGLFANLKANPNLTDGMGVAMGIYTQTSPHAPAQTKPRIKAESQPGHVRITGSKDYAELYNVYMRLVGTVAWTLVGIRRKKFPFDDQTPLKTPGVPEMREYMARGVIADEEVGQPSDIVQVTFGG
jgi:hypothetical protein